MRASRLVAAIAAAAAIASQVPASVASADASERMAPAAGAFFGIAGDMSVESTTRRSFSLHRVYETMGRNLIDGKVKDDAAKGRRTLLSVRANVPWAQIAAGRYDAELVREARQIKAFGRPILVGFHHEPEDDLATFGSAADFVAAFRRFVTVYRQQGVTNAGFTWILMTWNFRKGGSAAQFYPGDSYVDWVGVDGYNSSGCREGAPSVANYKSFADIFQGSYDFATAHRKLFVVAEYGSVEYQNAPGLKAKWLLGAVATAKRWPSLKGLAYFNHGVGGSSRCDWSLDTSASALTTFGAMARDPYFGTAALPARGNDVPVPGNFVGDGRADRAVFRPSSGTWEVPGSSPVHWGGQGDIPVRGNFVGDSRADRAVFRPSSGTWWVAGAAPVHWGARGDIPVPADFVGDSRTDRGVFRPSSGTWWVAGAAPVHWGGGGDIPVPADFDGDGKAERAVFRPSTGTWWVAGAAPVHWGARGDIPVPADFNGDGKADRAVFRPSTGTWWVAR